ncbi:MAG: glutamate--tRNA ligase [Campylobacterota bacterium]|nr:glutamate--tRNA ligase [Campylobacterota bacterium]
MVVTRFAPSPTGYLHIGGLRTALFSYLWARKNGGKFLLRIEDTDKSRNNDDATKAILNAFEWLGLEHDGEIEYQSKRDDIYASYIKQLLEEKKAYKCYMSKDELDALRQKQMDNKERTRYDGTYRDFNGTPPAGVEPVIRIKAPLLGKIVVDDGVKGVVEFNAEDILDDFVIARGDGTPTYNFVVAIDDALMGVNEVIRGDDHLTNTPKQLVIYEALGFEIPKFYHVPMIHNSNGKKLSKRDGATDVMAYKEMGFLPQALLNFLVRLGWSNGDQEIFSFEEMIELFNPQNINKSASIYNSEKLEWLNSHYIKNSSNSDLVELLKSHALDISSHDSKEVLLDELKQRAKTLEELKLHVEEILNAPTSYDAKAVKKAFKGEAFDVLERFKTALQSSEDVTLPLQFHDIMQKCIDELGVGFGKIGQPLRIALIGKMGGPGLDAIMAILGKDETINRIDESVKNIKEQIV